MFGLKFLNTKRECDNNVFFERRLFRQKGNDEMARFDAPALVVTVYDSGNTHFACEVTVGGEERDVSFRFKLPFLPALSISIENAAKELRKKAWAWAKKQAEENKAAGFHTGIYAHELDPFQGRATGVYLFENHLVFSLWKNVDAWSTEASRAAPWKHLGWSKSWFVDGARRRGLQGGSQRDATDHHPHAGGQLPGGGQDDEGDMDSSQVAAGHDGARDRGDAGPHPDSRQG